MRMPLHHIASPAGVRYALAELHIDEIRREKFSIGKKKLNPLTLDLHRAVTSLVGELYQKDIHFLMELIQNAEDNEYQEGVEPTLEFVLTKKDITGTGAPATLLVFNNEVGFSRNNIDSICSIGRSTKKGKRQRGFIREKGIGFKSVFLVSSQPHIFSNGYRIKFVEEPNQDCGIGYVVPEWVSGKPYLSSIKKVYGFNKILPTTTFILPLKPEKVEAVRAQLSELHPELLLFLSKIKWMYVRGRDPEESDDVSTISKSVLCKLSGTLSLEHCEKVDPREGLVGRGLIKIILGFLAGPMVNMSLQERHEAAKSIAALSVYKSDKPIQVCYRIMLSASKSVEVEKLKLVHWEKNSQWLLFDKSGYEGGKGDLEFVSSFADELAQGLLAHAKPTAADALSKIIQFGFMFDFNEDEVEFLLMKENLELLVEDAEFLKLCIRLVR